MSTLRLARFVFRIIRGLFRASGIGKIRLGNSLLYVPIRKKLYQFIWKYSARNPDKPLLVEGHNIWGIGQNRGGGNGMGLLMDSYEEDSTRLFKEFIQQGMAVIDIGAHVGYYTLLAARGVGSSGRVYAFEPERDNFRWLKKNIEMNGYTNVTTVPKAVTDETGFIKLWLMDSSGGHSIYPEKDISHGAQEDNGSGQKKELVETTTIDDFLEAEGWPSIGVIKIDAEGAEHQVFAGMQRLFKRQDNLKIIFEFNRLRFEEIGVNSFECLQSLQANNFTLHSIDRKKTNALSSDDILFLCSKSSINVNLLASKGAYEN